MGKKCIMVSGGMDAPANNLFYTKVSIYPAKFPIDLFQSFAPNSLYNCYIQLLISATGQTIILGLLQKQPFIVAHFNSSPHILCITAC